ncbi:MAG: hypothetical protein JWP11_3705 [Frankiales bacterium]|nr:hypothetical protein [Frankiales bacterium]
MSRSPVKPEQHGSLTGYTNGCRCTPCNAEHTRAVAARRRRKAMGIRTPNDRMPYGPTHRTVLRLREIGYTDPQIGRLAGLPDSRISYLRRPTGKYVLRETAERIEHALQLVERIPPRDLLAARYVDATGAQRRIRALMRQGWSLHELGRRLGHTGGYLSPLLYGGRRITPRLHATVTAVYDELWDQVGPSTSTAKRAASRGWPPPLWWDDDLIDDPTFDAVAAWAKDQRDARREPSMRRAEFAAEVADRTVRGHSTRQIAQDLGCSERHVVRTRTALRAGGELAAS